MKMLIQKNIYCLAISKKREYNFLVLSFLNKNLFFLHG